MTVTTEIVTKATEPCGCDGTGRIQVIERDDREVPIGNGLILGMGTSWTTRLCECRKSLAPRDGEARWWSSKTVYSESWASSVHQHSAEITVQAEVPVSEDNYVLKRTPENAYYPVMIDVDLSHDWLHALFPDEARALAALLVSAAERAEAIENEFA